MTRGFLRRAILIDAVQALLVALPGAKTVEDYETLMPWRIALADARRRGRRRAAPVRITATGLAQGAWSIDSTNYGRLPNTERQRENIRATRPGRQFRPGSVNSTVLPP